MVHDDAHALTVIMRTYLTYSRWDAAGRDVQMIELVLCQQNDNDRTKQKGVYGMWIFG